MLLFSCPACYQRHWQGEYQTDGDVHRHEIQGCQYRRGIGKLLEALGQLLGSHAIGLHSLLHLGRGEQRGVFAQEITSVDECEIQILGKGEEQ